MRFYLKWSACFRNIFVYNLGTIYFLELQLHACKLLKFSKKKIIKQILKNEPLKYVSI